MICFLFEVYEKGNWELSEFLLELDYTLMDSCNDLPLFFSYCEEGSLESAEFLLDSYD